MTPTATHLVGHFPEPYERALLDEVAEIARIGRLHRIVASRASPELFPPELASLRRRVRTLDVGLRFGPLLSGAMGMAAGLPALRPSAWRNLAQRSDLPRRLRLRRLLRRERPGLLHAQFGHLGLLALPVVKAEGLPLLVSFRGQDVGIVARRPSAEREELFRYAHRVLARSEAMRRDLAALGCPLEKIFVQPSRIDAASMPFHECSWPGHPEQVIVLMAGRFVPKKGMDDALRAVARLPRRPVVRLVGDGPQRTFLRQLADALGIGDRVFFAGPATREALRIEMLNAHLFLLPCKEVEGDREGVPNVLKEAQACGLPTLSTRHAGIPECVEHDVTGLLVPEGNVEALANGLSRLLSHPERWAEMGRRGREKMMLLYDIKNLAPEIVAHYDSVAKAGT